MWLGGQLACVGRAVISAWHLEREDGRRANVGDDGADVARVRAHAAPRVDDDGVAHGVQALEREGLAVSMR